MTDFSDKDLHAVGDSFKHLHSYMKSSFPVWEDFLQRGFRFQKQLEQMISAFNGFVDGFARIAEVAAHSKGGTQEVGATLITLARWHKGLELKMREINFSLNNKLLSPFGSRIEEWKKTLSMLDRDHDKEMHKAVKDTKEVMKGTSKANKTLDRSRKKRGHQLGSLQQQLEQLQQEVERKIEDTELKEKVHLNRLIVEERTWFSTFSTSFLTILDLETAIIGDLEGLKMIMAKLKETSSSPTILPEQAREFVENWRIPTVGSPSVMKNRIASQASINSQMSFLSLNSGSSNSLDSTGTTSMPGSMIPPAPPAGPPTTPPPGRSSSSPPPLALSTSQAHPFPLEVEPSTPPLPRNNPITNQTSTRHVPAPHTSYPTSFSAHPYYSNQPMPAPPSDTHDVPIPQAQVSVSPSQVSLVSTSSHHSVDSSHSSNRSVSPPFATPAQNPHVLPHSGHPVTSELMHHVQAAPPLSSSAQFSRTPPLTMQQEIASRARNRSFNSGQPGASNSPPISGNKLPPTTLPKQARPYVNPPTQPKPVRTNSISSGYTQPVCSGYTQPVSTGYTQPMSSGYTQPVSSGYAQPVSSGYAQPVSSGYAQPVSSGYAQPVSQPNPVHTYQDEESDDEDSSAFAKQLKQAKLKRTAQVSDRSSPRV